jgi:hypothetical protein
MPIKPIFVYPFEVVKGSEVIMNSLQQAPGRDFYCSTGLSYLKQAEVDLEALVRAGRHHFI